MRTRKQELVSDDLKPFVCNIMKEYREKQVAKEKAIAKTGEYNYIRLTDNKMDQMIELMMELKESLQDTLLSNPDHVETLEENIIIDVYLW